MDALKNTDNSAERTNKLMLALAALVGIMGTTVTGLGLSGTGAEGIPQLAAAAIPGVVAFLLSYLLYQTPAFAETTALPLDGELVALLPEYTESLPQPVEVGGMIPVYADAAQAVRHG